MANTHISRLAAAWFLFAAAIGCEKAQPPATPPANATGSTSGARSMPAGGGPAFTSKTLRIAVIPKGTTHEFWKSVHAGAQDAAKELGGVEIAWKGPFRESDSETQINLVQDFITQRVDGICLAPNDSRGLVAAVDDARYEGIPVVIFDSGLDQQDSYVSYVATDNSHGGALAAERLVECLGGKGNVLLLRYKPGSESTQQREDGFLAALEKFPAIDVLSSDQYLGDTPELSLDNATQILNKYEGRVDGVFTVCEPNSTGMLGALENLGLAGKVKCIAFDPNERLVKALADRKIDGIVLQDPVRMGYLAVKTLVTHLRGEPVERRIPTGETVATPDNLADEEIDRLLHPPQFGD
ncbi:MAG TPA: substrate-binding domain-containing protein [Pirellulales bacterium]|jgi:ribose transport system substrate-binding protein|nr:substrate-binding domain-containing protein [Pirellulales bacterium]